MKFEFKTDGPFRRIQDLQNEINLPIFVGAHKGRPDHCLPSRHCREDGWQGKYSLVKQVAGKNGSLLVVPDMDGYNGGFGISGDQTDFPISSMHSTGDLPEPGHPFRFLFQHIQAT